MKINKEELLKAKEDILKKNISAELNDEISKKIEKEVNEIINKFEEIKEDDQFEE